MRSRAPWRFPYPGQPYGIWKCADGREVLFDRHYDPLSERKDDVVSDADPKEWVRWGTQRWFFDDLSQSDRCKATRALLAHLLDEFRAGRSVDEWAKPARYYGPRPRRAA